MEEFAEELVEELVEEFADGVNDLALQADVSFPEAAPSSPNVEMPQKEVRELLREFTLRYDALKAQQAKKVARGLPPQFPEPNFLYTTVQTDRPTDRPTD